MAAGALAAMTVLAATVTSSLAILTLASSAAVAAWLGLAGYALTRLDRT
jgi:hypothetical protein